MTYDFLLESVWHPPLLFGGDHSVVLPGKIELKGLWWSGALGRSLRTKDGQVVEVEHPGEWNRGEGPDFLAARIKHGAQSLEGDVVVDERAALWQQEGRDHDERYQRVILHLSFRPGEHVPIERTIGGKEVPHVIVHERELADAMNRPQREVAISSPGRCHLPLRKMGKPALEKLLKAAARHRAKRLATSAMRSIEMHGRDQVLFEACAEALGYPDNRLSMHALSQRVSLASMSRTPTVDAAESRLLGVAGFLEPFIDPLVRPETLDYRRTLWDAWLGQREEAELSTAQSLHWVTSDQRPANHPQRRIGALATVLRHWEELSKLAFADPFEFKPLADLLGSIVHPFWSVHHRLTGPCADEPYTLFGRSQAVDLAARLLIPLALEEERLSWREYYKLRHSGIGTDIKHAARRLIGDADKERAWTRRVLHQQGLLQVDQDFLLEDISLGQEPVYAEQLQQWR
ncbi:MAG: DUF2851 family protein [Akkermansiaceae bacterium]|nr:DUF2851 family protein [Akkermansiaceae bacterium]